MFIAEKLAVVVVVLQPKLREFARIKREHGRDARAVASRQRVVRVVGARVTRDEFAAQSGHPARAKTPEHLTVKSVVLQSFRRQPNGGISARFVPTEHRFGLPGDEGKTRIGM